MKRFSAILSWVALIALLGLGNVGNAIAMNPLSKAANSPGQKCTKAGVVAKSGAVRVKCVKTGTKLLWQRVAIAKSASPSPASATQSPSAKPSASQSKSASLPNVQNEYQVNARGTAWSWSFSYQLDGLKSALVSDSSHSNILLVPEGKPVHIILKSTDVSHGFWVPGLGIDQEASPDSTGTITITPERTGIYPGACNIQCGRGHAGMKMSIEVVTETEFLKYLATLK